MPAPETGTARVTSLVPVGAPDHVAAAWSPAVEWLASANTRSTRDAYFKTLRAFVQGIGVAAPDKVTSLHVAAYKAHLVDRGLSPRTIRLRIGALRSFFAWCIAAGYHRGPNPAAGVTLPRAGGALAGRALTGEEVSRLVSAALNARDRALLWLLASGLRAGEAISLEQRDVRLTREAARPGAGAEILVRNGKGGRTRTVDVPYVVAEAIVAYAALHPRAIAPRAPLLQRLDGSGAELTYSNVYRIVVSCAERASLGWVAPHDLRRTYVTAALDLGMPLPQVQRQAGHVLMEQTARYYRAGQYEGNKVLPSYLQSETKE